MGRTGESGYVNPHECQTLWPGGAGSDTRGAIVDVPRALLAAALADAGRPGRHTRTVHRYELKSVVPIFQTAELRMHLRLHPAGFRRTYPNRWVNNIYFDSENMDAFLENLDGECARRKLRLRWYGDDLRDVRSTLEFKCKRGRIGWKLQQALRGTLDLEHVRWSELHQYMMQQVDIPMRQVLQERMRPAIINRYRREYLCSMDQKVRVTIDSDLCSYGQDMNSGPRFNCRLPQDPITVVELKADVQDRDQLTRVAQCLALRVSKHSKYATSLEGCL